MTAAVTNAARRGQMPGLITGFGATLRRDVSLALKRPGDMLNPLFFFAMVVTLFPLAVGPSAEQLQAIGPGVLWVAALLSVLLSLNSLFLSDFEDGSLDQLLTSSQPLPVLVFAKTVAHWLTSGFPLVLLSPLLAMTYQMPVSIIGILMLTLLLGTVSLSLLGSIGAALTVGLNHGTALLSLLILPLAMPVLLLGANTVALAVQNEMYSTGIWALCAYAVAALSLAPFAAAAALQISNE